MIVPCQPCIRRLPDELIRVGTSKEAQGRDKTRRGCGVRGDGSDREGALTCFPSGIKTQEDFQSSASVSPSAILKELPVTLAFLHKSRDNLSLFRSINEEIVSASEVTGACTCQLGCLWEHAEGESAISVPTNVLARWGILVKF